MKRFIVFVLVCLCVLNVNAQVKNCIGQKVVRKIEVYAAKSVKPYILVHFNYDNSLKLEEIVFTTPSKNKKIWRKENDALTHTEYYENGDLRTDLVYNYTIINGIVSECSVDNIRVDNNVLRYSYSYHYNINKGLLCADRRVYFRENYQDFVELSDRYRELFGWDENNNIFTSGEKGWQWKEGQRFDYSVDYDNRTYYKELKNDTNIDFSSLYSSIFNYDRFDMVTEWFGMHSSNLIETDNLRYFDYTYDNEYGGNDLSEERGNIVQIDMYNQDKRLETTYKIYYWE